MAGSLENRGKLRELIDKLQMMSLWSEEDEARYLGVVGRIIPVG